MKSQFAQTLIMLSAAILSSALTLHAGETAKRPLKVFILAGQSNMEGHARIETFDYIGDDPATAPLLKQMRGADGKPAVCDHVWISYLTGKFDGSANGEGLGKLTAGFGARGSNPTQDGGKIGPEFTFGLAMDAALKEPVLIIKTAWGGRSLNTEFRSPSAGPYEFSEAQLAQKQKQGKDIAAEKAAKAKETGRFYNYMVEHVKKVLADPKRVCPAYDPAEGYEIAGFVWLQGFNDLVDGNTYPTGADGKTRDYTKYGVWLADFIRDVRKDLSAPKMPFVIGVLGVGGMKADGNTAAFHTAMTAPSLLPEFKDNVIAVPTAPFWAEELSAIDEKRGKVKAMAATLKNKSKNGPNKDGAMTDAQQKEYLKKYEAEVITPEEATKWTRGASNAGYHYLGCAKTFALMGKAFAEANLKMLESQRH
ncbi:MAG: sialate O-acetylesterase [Planctomycetota bacterium]